VSGTLQTIPHIHLSQQLALFDGKLKNKPLENWPPSDKPPGNGFFQSGKAWKKGIPVL
jgi:hypothetical protein